MSTTQTDDESPIDGHGTDSIGALEATLDEQDYTTDELLAAIEYEEAHEDRKGAIDALTDAHDEATAGPDTTAPDPSPSPEAREDDGPDAGTTAMDADASEANDDGVIDRKRTAGAGGTEAGQPGVVFPDPYADDAPAVVRVVLGDRMHFAGDFYDEAGEHAVAYGMRVKTALETETNDVHLSRDDPLHPDHDEESGPAGEPA